MATRTYEVMYIIDPETPTERMEKLNEAVASLIEKEGGTVIRKEEYGLKTFAYQIQKKNEGYYVLYEINGSGQEIAELERRMRVNDMILRYITVRTDEERKDRRQADRKTRSTIGEASVVQTGIAC